MNTVRSNNSLERATAEWRLNVVLATITGLVVCVALVLNVLTLILGDDFLREP